MLKIYRASAGSGKTYRLTGDYIGLLFDENKSKLHQKILAVTFTNKATEEMKSRIILELSKMASGEITGFSKEISSKKGLSNEEITRRSLKMLIQILHDYSSFSINTIDSFFQNIIRAFARDIGIHGRYELELNTESVLDQAVDQLFMDLEEDKNKLLLDWLSGFAEEKIEKSETWNLRNTIKSLGFEIFKESYQHKADITNQKLHEREFLNKYKQNLLKIKKDFENKVMQLAKDALQAIQNNGLELSDFKGGSRSSIFNLTKVVRGDLHITDTFIKMSEDVSNCYTAKASSGIKEAIERVYANSLQAQMQEIINMIFLESKEYYSSIIILKNLNTLGILSDLAVQIKKLTADQQVMLISDSNLLLNRIIDNSDTPFIYEKTGVRLDHFMIDEFQDTSVLQWKNFLPLISNSLSENNDNLLVGDVKQSIYRWRNSDWKLLDSQVYADFAGNEIKSSALETNWRSDRNIIGFNNILFANGSKLLQEKLNEVISNTAEEVDSELNTKIENAYKDIEQKVSEQAGEGYVKIRFFDTKVAGEKFETLSLNELPGLLENLQDNGYKPGDIAILVRENKEEVQVINHLLQYKNSETARPDLSYNVMSNKGLLICSSPSVRFLLSLLNVLVNPDDEINRLILSYEYARGRLGFKSEQAIEPALLKHENKIASLFTDEDNQTIQSYRNVPLFEFTEKVIGALDICSWHDDVIFIQAFQDLVFRFSTKKSSDLNSFLNWWKKTGYKECIATPENDQAFNIMTIHKSKGLDFPVVIIPFCDWDIDSTKRNIFWCETDVMPFSEIPLIPVEYSSVLAKSIFAPQYYKELMHTYIDSLNLTYVAFTRPEHELIVHCPLPKDVSTSKLTNIGDMIYNAVVNHSNEYKSNFNNDSNSIIIGEQRKVVSKTKKPENQRVVRDYPVTDITGRLKVKHRYYHFADEENNLANPLDFGLLMHEILCNIKTIADISNYVSEFIRQGRISPEEGKYIDQELNTFLSQPEVEKWFRPGLKVKNETTILVPGGYKYRPDRIVFDGMDVAVIDYKFGEQELTKHEKQVKTYATLLQEMGYKPESWLYYVKLNKIKAVQ